MIYISLDTIEYSDLEMDAGLGYDEVNKRKADKYDI